MISRPCREPIFRLAVILFFRELEEDFGQENNKYNMLNHEFIE